LKSNGVGQLNALRSMMSDAASPGSAKILHCARVASKEADFRFLLPTS
jgi:hypothetical protein